MYTRRLPIGVFFTQLSSRATTSLLGNLGFIPPDSCFSCVEVKNQADWPGLQKEHPYLQNCRMISSSDAHDLNSLHEPLYFLEAEDASPDAILKTLEMS